MASLKDRLIAEMASVGRNAIKAEGMMNTARLAELVTQAMSIQDQKAASRSRKRERSAPRRKKEAASKAESDALHSAMFEAVMHRAAGRCELGNHEHTGPLDPHHLDGGSGKTRREWRGNVIAACRLCHHAYHSNPLPFVPNVIGWAHRYGYPIPHRVQNLRAQRTA